MEAICFSELLVFAYLTTRYYNLEDNNINYTFHMELDHKPPLSSLCNIIYFLTIADTAVARNFGVITHSGSVLSDTMENDAHGFLPECHVNFLP